MGTRSQVFLAATASAIALTASPAMAQGEGEEIGHKTRGWTPQDRADALPRSRTPRSGQSLISCAEFSPVRPGRRGCGGAAGCLARVCGQVRCCECGGGGVVSVCVGWWVQRVSVEGALVKPK